MRSVNIAICDDDKSTLKYIHKAITDRWGNDHSIYLFNSGQELIDYYREKRMPIDIVLLDIIMEAPDGIQTARTLREYDKQLIIIFLTSSKDFMLQGYAIHAYQYLIKGRRGIQLTELYDTLEDAIAQVSRREEALVLQMGKEYRRILLYDILYIDVDNKHIQFHIKNNEVIKVFGTLKEHTSHLPREFMHIDAGCVVNMERVEGVNTALRSITLSDNTTLYIARGRVSRISQEFLLRYRRV